MGPARGSLRGLALCGALAVVSCKETSHSMHDDERNYVMARQRAAEVERAAADAVYLQKNSNFYFRVFEQQFARKLDELPQKGEVPVEKRPYTGGYYPNSAGGTNVRTTADTQTVMQKYDKAFNPGTRRAELWEQCNQGPIDCDSCNNETGQCLDTKQTKAVAWAGHCNGFSAAAQRHREPTRDVTRGDVVFRPQDIKALLAEIYLNADFEFLGGNRCEKAKNTDDPPPVRAGRSDPTAMSECEDINPGTLHAALGNWIGRSQHTLIMDLSRDRQIWNYPLYKYEVQVLEKDLTAQQAVALLAGNTNSYVFNPTAVRFAKVTNKLTYANAEATETLNVLKPYAITLEYVLELNSAGEIVGGEWIGASEMNHPDFLWVALEPMAPNGTKFMGNPNLDTAKVLELWAESAGFDPQKPPLAIKRPSETLTWGKWPSFEVTLDGNKRGAVFAGKPAVLEIARAGGLASGNVELELLLNGIALAKLTGDGAQPMRHSFEPGLGLNRLQFVWKKDGAQVEEQYLRFHVLR